MLDYGTILNGLKPLHELLHAPIAVMDEDGRIHSNSCTPDICVLCGGKNCNTACADASYAGGISLQLGYAFMQECRAGVVIMAAPISVDGRVWYALLGPVLLWDWDDYAIRAAMDSLLHSSPDYERLRAAGAALPRLDCTQARAAAELLMDTCIALVGRNDYLDEQRRQADQQADVSYTLHDDKQANATEGAYPLNTELELLGKVRIGDRGGARAILNKLLGHIFYGAGGSIELIKARSLELVIMISRAAVEGGAELNKLLGLNYVFVAELSSMSQFEEICMWLVKVLDKFMDTVYETRDRGSTYLLRLAIAYMEDNHGLNLTLESVAGKVHISSYYLSHLFKDELGVTFLEQLTRIRIEHARQLLVDTHMAIGEVAAAVGYEDASHFAKLFKRYSGRSPAVFRKGGQA